MEEGADNNELEHWYYNIIYIYKNCYIINQLTSIISSSNPALFENPGEWSERQWISDLEILEIKSLLLSKSPWRGSSQSNRHGACIGSLHL